MAVRPIDAVQVLHNINLHHRPTPVSEFESGFNDGLNQAMWEITHAPTLTQPNEPLTLEELREMDGEPVWGKSLITGKPGEWFILRVVEMSKTWFIACAGAEQGFGDKDTYGETWVAYRRPPEGEGRGGERLSRSPGKLRLYNYLRRKESDHRPGCRSCEGGCP